MWLVVFFFYDVTTFFFMYSGETLRAVAAFFVELICLFGKNLFFILSVWSRLTNLSSCTLRVTHSQRAKEIKAFFFFFFTLQV